MTIEQWIRRKRLAATVTLSIVLLLGAIIGLILERCLTTSKRSVAQSLAFGQAQMIAQRLQEAAGPAYMLASLVQRGKGQIDDFNAVGEEMLQSFPMVQAVELAPGGVVTQVFPLQGNESVIGHDLLKDRERNREAHLAVASRQLSIAGPFPLMQGGIGAVARYPVFLPGRNGRDSFWGFTIVLIRVPELLNSAGVLELSREGYRYQLCRVIPGGNTCEVFASNGKEVPVVPVTVPVNVPNGHWQLSLAPEAGWVTAMEKLLIAAGVLLVALLLGALQYIFLRNLQQTG